MVRIADFGLTIGVAWLSTRSRDSEWPRPVIVAALARGDQPVSPFLAHDRQRARDWVAPVRRGIPPSHILELPAADRRSACARGRVAPTIGDVLDHHSVVEESSGRR